MADIQELRLIVKEIRANPANWTQKWWGWRGRCGTSYCIAGHAVERAGYPMIWEPMVTGYRAGYCRMERGDRPIGEVAQQLLDLTAGQARLLFAGSNTLEDIEALIGQWEAEQLAAESDE